MSEVSMELLNHTFTRASRAQKLKMPNGVELSKYMPHGLSMGFRYFDNVLVHDDLAEFKKKKDIRVHSQ